jgi:hypothetical protein
MPRGKSSNGDARGSGANLPVLVDRRLVKALDHVLRQHILLAAIQGPVSPSELSKLFNEGLSQVSYHMKVLHEDCDEMIELKGTKPRRGAVEHYYRTSAKTLLPAKAWRHVKKGMRAVVGAGQASDLFNDLAEALKAGKLQGAHDHITRTPLVLDAEGGRKVKAIAERATKEVENEQQASAKRMEKANGNGKATGYTFAMLAFEAAWEPADLHALVARVKGGAAASGNGAHGGAHKGGGRKSGGRKARAAGK